MPKLEFLLKRKELIKKSKEDSYLNRLINPEPTEDEEDNYKVFYTPIMLDIADINIALQDDEEHTALFDRLGEIYIIKCKYSKYKYIEEHLTGQFVRSAEMFSIDDGTLEKIDKINQVINSSTI